MLGAGTDEAKIKEVLQSFDPAKLQVAKDAYELKYGANLTGDVMDELGGSDKVEAARELRVHKLLAKLITMLVLKFMTVPTVLANQ